MKKQIKILGVLAVALTLGLTACNGGGDNPADSKDGTSSRHVHAAAENAPWQSDDSRHWKDCSANDGGKVDNKAHTFGDPYDVVPATCEAAGSQKVKCTVCEKEVAQEIRALGHDWVDDETGGTPATCTTAGSKNQHCSRCDATQAGVEIPALGHDFGEWEDVEGKAATCTEAGQQQRKCSRCDEIETQEVTALGHDMQLIGDDTEPEAGKAKVRVYTCANGCGQTYLGFKANEVSDESKEHLVIGEDGGAAFWGRPIGNALALDANGTSVNQQNNEVVYCTTETGDFFEYVFDLTADQVETLGEKTLLYCDAKPANYLNGADFFAYSASNDDWTPGYYIDGGEGHYEVDEDSNPVMVKDHARATEAGIAGEELETEVKMGKRIEDYRYILYVDGEVKAFDDSIKNPTHGSNTNMRREEFILPYVFNLHVGENRISLRMSGGYRSTFYNFTFRPFEEDETEPVHVHSFVAGTKDGIVTPETCECGLKAYNLAMADADAAGWHDPNTKWNAKTGTNTTATWDITGKIPSGKYAVYANVKMTSSSHANRCWYNQSANDPTPSSSPDTADQDPYRYFFKLDGVTVNPDVTATWGELNISNTAYNYAEVVSEITISGTSASLQMLHGNIGYSLFVANVRLIQIAA